MSDGGPEGPVAGTQGAEVGAEEVVADPEEDKVSTEGVVAGPEDVDPAAQTERAPGPRRRPRRAVAPPTNPEADQSDDVPGQRPTRGAATGPAVRRRGHGDAPDRVDPRDAWIQAQRPPHWD